jgi:hypothetical protein
LQWKPKPDKGGWDDIFGGVLRSTDNGRTWKRHGWVQGDEPTIVECPDGSLLMYLRRYGWVWESRSRDKGITWEPSSRTNLVSPDTAHFLYKLKDGRIALAYNDHPMLRTALSIRISKDGGKSWGLPTVIDSCTIHVEPNFEEYAQVSYPSLAQLSNGHLAMTWTDLRYDPQYRRAGQTFAWGAKLMKAQGVIKYAEIDVSPSWEAERKIPF